MLALSIKKLDLKVYFISLKDKSSGYTKILDLVIFRFFLFKCFTSVLALALLLLPISSIVMFLLVNIRSLTIIFLKSLIWG